MGPHLLFDSFCTALEHLGRQLEPGAPKDAALTLLHIHNLAPLFESLFEERAGMEFADPRFSYQDELPAEEVLGGGGGGAASALSPGARSQGARVTTHVAGHKSLAHGRRSRLVLDGDHLQPGNAPARAGGTAIPIGVLSVRPVGASWMNTRLYVAKNPSEHTPAGVLPGVVGAAKGVGLFHAGGGGGGGGGGGSVYGGGSVLGSSASVAGSRGGHASAQPFQPTSAKNKVYSRW
jgi:hypothetical protein